MVDIEGWVYWWMASNGELHPRPTTRDVGRRADDDELTPETRRVTSGAVCVTLNWKVIK